MPVPELLASHDQKGHVTPNFDCLYLRNAVAPLIMLFASYNTDAKISHVEPYFSHHDQRNGIVPLMTLLMPCYTNASTNMSHNQTSHVIPHFSCLDLRNAVLSLMMPVASHDSHADITGMT